MKEMVYTIKRKQTVLDDGEYKGYHYVIKSLGSHPCAYVEIPENNSLYGKSYDDLDYISCHGGLTYSENHLVIDDNGSKLDGWFIGWDYAHAGDVIGTCEILGLNEKRWTTGEMLQEVHSVIEQIIAINYLDK